MGTGTDLAPGLVEGRRRAPVKVGRVVLVEALHTGGLVELTETGPKVRVRKSGKEEEPKVTVGGVVELRSKVRPTITPSTSPWTLQLAVNSARKQFA